MKIVIIAAVAENNVIGRSSGEMPWHSKEEFQHFKNTTLGYPVIMGRKTFESLGKPLLGRLNIVLSRNGKFNPEDSEVVVLGSLTQAYKYCRERMYEKIFVIGGGHIFKDAMDDADEMIISRMKLIADGDVFFPEIKRNLWRINNTDHRSEFVINYYVKNTN